MTVRAHSLEELKSSRTAVAPIFPWVRKQKVMATERHQGAPVTCLLSDRQVHVPSLTFYRRTVNRLESSTAVQQLSRVEIPFDPEVESLTIHSISIFRNGKLTNYAEPGKIELIRREQQLEAGILNGQVSALILINDVRIGDVLDVEFSITTTETLFDNDLSVIQQTESSYFIGRWHFSWMDIPGREPRISAFSPALEHQVTEEESITIRSWAQSHLKPKEPEPNLPADVLPFAFIQISNFSSWQEVVSPILPHWQKEPRDRTGLDLELEEIRNQSAGDRDNLIDLAVASARDAVRYLAYSPGLLSMVPTDLSEVWERRFGDCKEKSLLLCWLLGQVEIDATPVLVNTNLGKALPALIPAPIAFDHVVVKVDLADRTLWIDPTDVYRGGRPSGWTHLPYHWCLPLSNSATDLVEIPACPVGETYMKIRETISSNGSSRSIGIDCHLEAGGGRANWLRGMLDSQGMNGIQNFLKQLMSSTRKDVEITETPLWQDNHLENRVQLEFKATVRDGIQQDPEYARDRLGITPFGFVGLLPIPDGSNRKFPLALNGPDSVVHEVILNHPKAPKIPATAKHELHSTFEVRATSRMEGASLAMLFSCAILKDRVEPIALTGYRHAANRAYGLFDLSINLPIAGRRNSSSSDPELSWGGGISSPEAARAGEAMETARIVQFVVIGIIVIVVLIRLVTWIMPVL